MSSDATVATHTWWREGYAVTDVLPRNAIITDAGGKLRAIDFVVTQIVS